MLTEDDVIDAVIAFVTAAGWTVESRCRASETGYDLVAVRDGVRLIVEAKGAGSSKAHTNRYGKAFTRNQVLDHVAKAVLAAMRVLAHGGAQAGIALPDNEHHRHELARVQGPLARIGISIFWVSDDRSVTAEWAGGA